MIEMGNFHISNSKVGQISDTGTNIRVAAVSKSTARVDWRWFIVGCVLLASALCAFFWAFSMEHLSPSRRFLLMWLLPLASAFGCGSFAGSMKLTGPVGKLTVAATSGFAVWILSYYLLPTI
jgi:hypothetical protein